MDLTRKSFLFTPEEEALVQRLAAELGTHQTDAVRRGLFALDASLQAQRAERNRVLEDANRVLDLMEKHLPLEAQAGEYSIESTDDHVAIRVDDIRYFEAAGQLRAARWNEDDVELFRVTEGGSLEPIAKGIVPIPSMN